MRKTPHSTNSYPAAATSKPYNNYAFPIEHNTNNQSGPHRPAVSRDFLPGGSNSDDSDGRISETSKEGGSDDPSDGSESVISNQSAHNEINRRNEGPGGFRSQQRKPKREHKDVALMREGRLLRVMEIANDTITQRFLQFDPDQILVRSFASASTAGPYVSVVAPSHDIQILLYDDTEFVHIIRAQTSLLLFSPVANGDCDAGLKECLSKFEETLKCSVRRLPSMRGCVNLSVSLLAGVQRQYAERKICTQLTKAARDAYEQNTEMSKKYVVAKQEEPKKQDSSIYGVKIDQNSRFAEKLLAARLGQEAEEEEHVQSVVILPPSAGVGLSTTGASSAGPLFAVNELCLMLRRGAPISTVSSVVQRIYPSIDTFEIKNKLENGETLAECIISLLSVMTEDIHTSSLDLVAEITSYIIRVMAEENVLTVLSEDDYRQFITTLITSLVTRLVAGHIRSVEMLAASMGDDASEAGSNWRGNGSSTKTRMRSGNGQQQTSSSISASEGEYALPPLPIPSPPLCRCIAACLSVCHDFDIVGNLMDHHFPNDANNVITGTNSDTLGYTGRSYGYILVVHMILQCVTFTVRELSPAVLTHHTAQMETLFKSIVTSGGELSPIVAAAAEADCGIWSREANKKQDSESTGRVTTATAASHYDVLEVPRNHLMISLHDSHDMRVGVNPEVEAVLQFLGNGVAVALSLASSVLNEVTPWAFPHLRQKLDSELSFTLMDWCWQLIIATNHATWECSPVVSGAVLCDALPEMISVLRRSVHWCELSGFVSPSRRTVLMLAGVSTLLSKCAPRSDPFDLTSSFSHEWIIKICAFCGGMAEQAAYYEFHLHYCAFLQRHRNRLWWTTSKQFGRLYVDWWSNVKRSLDSIARTMPSPSAALASWERIAGVADCMAKFPNDRDTFEHRVSLGVTMFNASEHLTRVLRHTSVESTGGAYFVAPMANDRRALPIVAQLQLEAWEDYDEVFNSVPPIVSNSEEEAKHALYATTSALIYTLDWLTVEALSDRLGSAAACLGKLSVSLLKAGCPPYITRRLSEGSVHLMARNKRGSLEGVLQGLSEHFSLSLLYRPELSSALSVSDLPSGGSRGNKKVKYISSIFLEASSMLYSHRDEDDDDPEEGAYDDHDQPRIGAPPSATPLSLPIAAYNRQQQHLLSPVNQHNTSSLNNSNVSLFQTPQRLPSNTSLMNRSLTLGSNSNNGIVASSRVDPAISNNQSNASQVEEWPESRDRTPLHARRVRSFGTPIQNSLGEHYDSRSNNNSMNTSTGGLVKTPSKQAGLRRPSPSRMANPIAARTVDVLEMISESYR